LSDGAFRVIPHAERGLGYCLWLSDEARSITALRRRWPLPLSRNDVLWSLTL